MTLSDLKTRLQVAKEILKYKDYNGQIMTCGKCGSTYIRKINDNRNAVHYRSQYVCEVCGCRGIETQEWETSRVKQTVRY